jgi:hypothetical protein
MDLGMPKIKLTEWQQRRLVEIAARLPMLRSALKDADKVFDNAVRNRKGIVEEIDRLIDERENINQGHLFQY